MQPSKSIRYRNRIVKDILFLFIFWVLNRMVSFVLEPLSTTSEEMWTRYTNTENIDTIIVGNSIGEMLDTDVVNADLNCISCNMCTPKQNIPISFDAIKVAAKQNPIKRVVLVSAYDGLTRAKAPVSERIFRRTMIASFPFAKRRYYDFLDRWREATDDDNFDRPESIKAWFPWIDDSQGDMAYIWGNIEAKTEDYLSGKKLGDGYGYSLDTVRFGRVDAGWNAEDERLFQVDYEYSIALDRMGVPEGTIGEYSLERLNDICVYCRDNGIDFILIMMPHRSDYKSQYGDYYDTVDEYTKNFVESRGFKYHNFEEDEGIHERIPDEYFYDIEHVSSEHGKELTKLIDECVTKLEEN